MTATVIAIGIAAVGTKGSSEAFSRSGAETQPDVGLPTAPGTSSLQELRRAVRFYREATWRWQRQMGRPTTPTSNGEQSTSHAYVAWVASVWKERARAAREAYEKWWKERGQVISRLDRGLANAGGFVWLQSNPMRGLGSTLEKYGRRYGVSPYLMVATAATESSLGIAACSNNRFNVWGLASCNQSWDVPAFRNWDEAIGFYANFLASRWPGHSTPYSFRGYAACSDCWARKVSYWMGALFGVPARTRYP